MKMDFLRKLQRDFSVIKRGAPGRRFRDYRRFKNSSADTIVYRIAIVTIALILIIVGLAIGWLPGPGGFLSVIGLAMLAPFIPGAPYSLDKSEILIRRTMRYLKNRWHSSGL